DYITNLEPPRWDDIFSTKINRALAAKGKRVYLEHCDRCHGHPENYPWEQTASATQSCKWNPGALDGKLVPQAEIRTDSESVSFRGFEEIPEHLSDHFPKSHPFQFPREDLRPKHRDNPNEPVERAYINKRMHGM